MTNKAVEKYQHENVVISTIQFTYTSHRADCKAQLKLEEKIFVTAKNGIEHDLDLDISELITITPQSENATPDTGIEAKLGFKQYIINMDETQILYLQACSSETLTRGPKLEQEEIERMAVQLGAISRAMRDYTCRVHF